jgi:hypothetical protein
MAISLTIKTVIVCSKCIIIKFDSLKKFPLKRTEYSKYTPHFLLQQIMKSQLIQAKEIHLRKIIYQPESYK